MQITNPLPFSFATIQIGGITAPSTLATQANLTVPLSTSQIGGGVSGQVGMILTNTSATLDVYLTDTSITTFQVGTKLGAGQIASLDGSFAIRVANHNASAVTVAINCIKA